MEIGKAILAMLILLVLVIGIGVQVANDPLWFLRKRLWVKGEIWNNKGVFKNPAAKPEPFIWQRTKS